LKAPASVANEDPAEAPKPIDPERPASADRPAVTDPWREGLERLQALARLRAGEPGQEDSSWPLRARLLDWLAGDGLSPDQSAGWARVLTCLATAYGPDTPDDIALSDRVEEAIDTLQSLAPFRITALHLCRKVRGFGDFELIETSALRAGQPLIVYCEVDGLRYANTGDGFASRLGSRVEVIANGTPRPVWAQELGTAEDLCSRRRRDNFVNYRLSLPASLPPGSYDLRLIQTDLIGERTSSATVPFEVRP
jgi:hypothetical protein